MDRPPAAPKAVAARRLLPIGGDGRGLPYFAARPLDGPLPDVDRVLIVVHGTERDGARYFRSLSRTLRRASAARTLLIAPQFSTRRDLKHRGGIDRELSWTGRGWKEGAAARDGPSSFAALDVLLHGLASRALYPRLRRVVVVGHSAGAQFVQRYAAASPAEDALPTAGIIVRYVVANPSSYLYLDPARRGFGHRGGFAPPPASAVAACRGFDRYKYGLSRLNPYMEAVGAETIRRRYGEREVVYLLGERDDDPDHDSLDRSCAAMFQGPHRLARGLIFQRYLRHLYGPGITRRHRLALVPGIGHEGTRLFRSAVALRWLLDLSAAG